MCALNYALEEQIQKNNINQMIENGWTLRDVAWSVINKKIKMNSLPSSILNSRDFLDQLQQIKELKNTKSEQERIERNIEFLLKQQKNHKFCVGVLICIFFFWFIYKLQTL